MLGGMVPVVRLLLAKVVIISLNKFGNQQIPSVLPMLKMITAGSTLSHVINQKETFQINILAWCRYARNGDHTEPFDVRFIEPQAV